MGTEDAEYWQGLTEREHLAIAELLNLGGDDGAHHKQYALDQVLRILTGCPTIVKTRTGYAGKEYSYNALGKSDLYKRVIAEYEDGEDGPETYEWEEGIAP